jgi:hypothetical protein
MVPEEKTGHWGNGIEVTGGGGRTGEMRSLDSRGRLSHINLSVDQSISIYLSLSVR